MMEAKIPRREVKLWEVLFKEGEKIVQQTRTEFEGREKKTYVISPGRSEGSRGVIAI